MEIDKNATLVNIITGISYMYPTVPISVTSSPDKYHKVIFLGENISFNKIYFTPGTAKFTEKEKDEDAGTIYEQEVKFIFPGDDDDTNSLLDILRNRPLLIKITFDNLKRKLIGIPENPAKFQRVQQINDKNSSHEITFTCKANEQAWFIYYEGPDIPH